MFVITKKIFFTLEAVVDIAYYSKAGNNVQSKDIAGRQGISQRYLEGVLQQLVRANILKGARGPLGGYCLARERRRITIADIISGISQDDDFGYNLIKNNDQPSLIAEKIIMPFYSNIYREMLVNMKNTTIEDLCNNLDKEKTITKMQEINFSI